LPWRHGWIIEPGWLRLGPFLRVSFQRYPRPASGILDAPPSTWGALPIGARKGELVVPLADDEALWLGLSVVRPEVVVAFRVAAAAEAELDAVTGAPWSDELQENPPNYVPVPPMRSIDGVQQGQAIVPFARTLAAAGGFSALYMVAIPSRRIDAGSRSAGTRPLRVPASGGRSPSAAPEPGHGPWHLERSARAHVTFAPYDAFERKTGRARPPPLSGQSIYRGWRLP
jgi:hypothetical protein